MAATVYTILFGLGVAAVAFVTYSIVRSALKK